MCATLNLSTEKKTPFRVLFIRTAGSMIAVVFRQAIDMTAREGDQVGRGCPFCTHQVLLYISPGPLRIGWTAAVVKHLEFIDVGSRLGSYHQRLAVSSKSSCDGGWVVT